MKTEFDTDNQTATIEAPRNTPTSASSHAWDDEVPEASAFKKYGLPVVVGVLLAGGIGYVANSLSKKSAAPPPPKQETMIVRVDAPKPTPPPVQPPPPPPQAEEKKQDMVEEVKQEDAPPEPTPQVETALKGGGNSGMVLKSGNGSGIFGNRNTVSGERMRWSAYAGQVKARIKAKLETSPKKLKPGTQIVIRVWLDNTGRITRARIDGSTSDSTLDASIRDEMLPGLQVSEPPPPGMPMPINMRITAQPRG